MSESLDELELELRRLPGVVAVGLAAGGEALHVRLCVERVADAGELRRRARVLALGHHERVDVATVVAGAPNGC